MRYAITEQRKKRIQSAYDAEAANGVIGFLFFFICFMVVLIGLMFS